MHDALRWRTMAFWLALLAIVGWAGLDHVQRLDGIVDGDHFFRQAHVLSNIDRMLQDGVLSVPAAWNDDQALRFYDFPVYQAIVAVTAQATGVAPAWLAEAFSLLLLATLGGATMVLLYWLRVPRTGRLLALAILLASPLGRFWSCAALPDNLALCLGALSLLGWLGRERVTCAFARRWTTSLWLGTSFLATLVKPPVYLPVAVTTLFLLAARRRQGRPETRLLFAFVGATALGVVALQIVAKHANAGLPGWPDVGTELAWYFGSLDERLSFASHARVLGRIVKEAVTLPGFLLAVWFWSSRDDALRSARHLLRTWSLAAIGSSLLFLHVNVVHNYYQLPCVAPLALSAGCGGWLVLRRLGLTITTRSPRLAPIAMTTATTLLLASIALSSQKYFARIAAPTTAHLRAVGAFVAAHTDPGDRVLYGTATDDDNPAFLYFAQRHGHNTPIAELRTEATTRRATEPQRLVVYAPSGEVAHELAQGPGWKLLAHGELGSLLLAP